MNRLIAIGDVHGCINELVQLLEMINITKNDEIVFLGDLVDRGPDSMSVVYEVRKLMNEYNVKCLLGNHEKMMIDACSGNTQMSQLWQYNGGAETLDSYRYKDIMIDDVQWMKSLPLYYETDDFIFTHASIPMDIPINELPDSSFIWRRPNKIDELFDFKHHSGKTVVCGHTIVNDIEIKDKYIMVDTGCFSTGKLTAIDVNTKQVWQTNEKI